MSLSIAGLQSAMKCFEANAAYQTWHKQDHDTPVSVEMPMKVRYYCKIDSWSEKLMLGWCRYTHDQGMPILVDNNLYYLRLYFVDVRTEQLVQKWTNKSVLTSRKEIRREYLRVVDSLHVPALVNEYNIIKLHMLSSLSGRLYEMHQLQPAMRCFETEHCFFDTG